MKLPEVAVFDLGKVLVDFDYSIAARRIAARSTMPPTDIQKFIDHSPILVRYETGLMSREEFYSEIRAITGFLGDIEEFGSFFADIFSPMDEMIRLHAQLREHRVPTFIFSNTNDLAISHIRRNFPFFANFDDYVLSYEHGAMKPHAKLYEVVERVTAKRGAQILYLDDRPENAEAGVSRGWHVIQHHDPAASIRRVKELELLPKD
ncbi:MAG: HAD family phosphatase [Verrucomicrobia bacterium]|nr:HAD family phosphatase [Verrucomicrobiota bacterium]